jgi:hypothetical protein
VKMAVDVAAPRVANDRPPEALAAMTVAAPSPGSSERLRPHCRYRRRRRPEHRA